MKTSIPDPNSDPLFYSRKKLNIKQTVFNMTDGKDSQIHILLLMTMSMNIGPVGSISMVVNNKRPIINTNYKWNFKYDDGDRRITG